MRLIKGITAWISCLIFFMFVSTAFMFGAIFLSWIVGIGCALQDKWITEYSRG